jgi:hypothetical protein
MGCYQWTIGCSPLRVSAGFVWEARGRITAATIAAFLRPEHSLWLKTRAEGMFRSPPRVGNLGAPGISERQRAQRS